MDDETPVILWHYTDVSGLLGILQGHSIWLTDARYLNDSRELLEGEDLVKTSLSAAAPPEVGEKRVTVRQLWEALAFPGGSTRVVLPSAGPYVASFCTEGDLLSQWRNYAGGNGYAVGFGTSQLSEATRAGGGDLIAVEYVTAATQVDLPAGGSMTSNLMGDRSYAPTVSTIARYKHQAFSEEKEWRAVLPDGEVEFRPGANGVTPYVELKLPAQAVNQVRVGPGHDTQLREQAVARLLAATGREPSVSASSSPYRG